MNGIIRKAMMVIIVMLLIVPFVPVSVMAGGDKCAKEGCNRENTSNGTIYCDLHAAEYAREKGYKVCAVNGCYSKALSKTQYCSRHKCRKDGCSSKAEEAYGYCKTHGNKKSSSSTSGYSSKKNSSKKTYKSSSSSKKKYDPYDVYSYKSAQDFADDKYEEFYDYEDDYDDEDEAYDAAEDYWRDHHR